MNKDNYFEDLKTQNAYILQGQDNAKEKRAGFLRIKQCCRQDGDQEFVDPSEASDTDVTLAVIDDDGVYCMECSKTLYDNDNAPALYEQCKTLERALDELAKQAKGCAYAEQSILTLEALGIDKDKLREVLAKADGRAEG